MDKVLMQPKDVDSLLKWRDKHKELVRSCPCPVKAIEIRVKVEGGTHIVKANRDGDNVTLYYSEVHDMLKRTIKRGKVKMKLDNGFMVITKNEMPDLTTDNIQTLITVYCSLMALMVYSDMDNTASESKSVSVKSQGKHTSQRKPKKKSQNVTYLLHSGKYGIGIHRAGNHASPAGTFNVRGHYRHYKDGRTVWIEQYKKGTGKRRDKMYKLGKTNKE